MSKSPELESFLNQFAIEAFGRSRTQSIREHVCVICGGPARDFEDMLSRREYAISGMCQKCQDETFVE